MIGSLAAEVPAYPRRVGSEGLRTLCAACGEVLEERTGLTLSGRVSTLTFPARDGIPCPRCGSLERRNEIVRVTGDTIAASPLTISLRSYFSSQRPLRFRPSGGVRGRDVRLARHVDLHVADCACRRARGGTCRCGSGASAESPSVPRFSRGSRAHTWRGPGLSAPTTSSAESAGQTQPLSAVWFEAVPRPSASPSLRVHGLRHQRRAVSRLVLDRSAREKHC